MLGFRSPVRGLPARSQLKTSPGSAGPPSLKCHTVAFFERCGPLGMLFRALRALRQRTFGSGAFRPALAKNDPLDHFSGAAGPLDSQRANQLELANKLVSASLVKTPSEFPGKKNKGEIPEK